MLDHRYMMLTRMIVTPLRALLAVAFCVLVVLELFSIPGQFAYQARIHPEHAGQRWPFTLLWVAVVVAVQVVIVCTWRLLTLVQTDRIFTRPSLKFVDVIIGALSVAWLLVAGFSLYVVLRYADDPGAPLLMFLVLTVAAVVLLLVIVLRSLLLQATSLRTDLDAVI
jgi:hypothetical protein